jgi:branched-chain amino acid transport system substrate-binding protein
MRMRSRLLTGVACVASAAALSACGSTTATTTTITGGTLTVYASLPLSGPESAEAHDVLDAEELALRQAGGKVGRYTIDLTAHNDATSAGWSPKLIADNARQAIQTNDAIAYIGEIDPNASAESIPITNADDLLQVSPYDTAIGLTQATPAVSGSPKNYYESLSTYGRTFARVVPNDTYQARAELQVMESQGVKKLFIAQDGTAYGDAIALAVDQDASKYGITALEPERSASSLAGSGADAMFYGGVATPATVGRIDGVFNAAAGTSGMKLFGPSGLYTSAFASGLSAAAQKATYLSEPGLTTAELPPAGKSFLSAFTSAYGHTPWTQAIFGYTAMQVVLRAIRTAGADADNRADVIDDVLGAKNISSALGTFSIDKDGDTSLAPYVFSRVKGGKLVLFKGTIVTS